MHAVWPFVAIVVAQHDPHSRRFAFLSVSSAPYLVPVEFSVSPLAEKTIGSVILKQAGGVAASVNFCFFHTFITSVGVYER